MIPHILISLQLDKILAAIKNTVIELNNVLRIWVAHQVIVVLVVLMIHLLLVTLSHKERDVRFSSILR